ncbi:uncharacterized protein LOC128953823 [Oppia nitens]|uniref:uncharacterized protein LOC128953823 n=1 Tax=Oppia nitens TaxID=1686743 RepID=UPI0023DA96EF|nr:uncharacterized protein LOC128953823 [Oppia nitens]
MKLSKQVASILTFALKNAFKHLCKKGSKRAFELISATPCVNQANAEITKCYTSLVDIIQGIKYAEENKRIPHLCCEYYTLFPCLYERTKRFTKCTTKKMDIASDFVRNIFENIISLLCGDYTDQSDKCQTLGINV